MMRRLVIAGIAMLAGGFVGDVMAADRLVAIGKGTINPNETGVVIDVSKAPGAYRGFRLRTASKGSAELTRVQIVYAGGGSYNHDKEFTLHENERTREIDERPDDIFVDRIILSTKPSTDRTVVEVLGIQSRAGARKARPKPATGEIATTPTSPAPSAAKPGIVEGNDVMFGYQNVGFALDRDVIKVGGEVGKFDRIRLRVLGNAIHILTLKVVYVDGEQEDIAVDADIKENAKTGWFELKGGRFIREIQMLYSSKPSLKGQARVEVTGQYADGWLG
jgi:hypothetical protein